MKQKTELSALAAIGVAALLVTGCSSSQDVTTSGNETPQRSVYEFNTPAYGSDGELTIQVPQKLKDVAPEAKDLLITSVTAKAREIASAKYCAVDLMISYIDGATNKLIQPLVTKEEAAKAAEADLASIVRLELRGNTVEEFVDYYQKAFQSDPSAAKIAQFESARAKLKASYDASGRGAIKETTDLENLAYYLTGEQTGKLIGDLDPNDPTAGVYASDDYKTLTFVQSCAESPTEVDTASTFDFPKLTSNKPSTFGSVDMTVMKNGALTIVSGDIEDYKLDTNGDWIAE